MFHELCCYCCKHFRAEIKDTQETCDAFPAGIPENHFCNGVFVKQITDGRIIQPAECANGVKFELKDNYEDPWKRAERLRKDGLDVPE